MPDLDHFRTETRAWLEANVPPLLRGKLIATGPGLLLGLPGEPELLVLGFEDEFLLARPRLGLDAARLRLRCLHPLGCPHRAGQGAE